MLTSIKMHWDYKLHKQNSYKNEFGRSQIGASQMCFVQSCYGIWCYNNNMGQNSVGRYFKKAQMQMLGRHSKFRGDY